MGSKSISYLHNKCGKLFTKVSTILITLTVLIFTSCENADNLMKKGDVLWEAAEYEQAAVLYGKAIKKKPSAELYYKKGSMFYNMQKYNTALDDFNNAINIDKDYEKAYKWRGYTYNALEDYKNAANDLKNYTRVVQDDHGALLMYSQVLYNIDEIDDAIKTAAMAIELDPDMADGFSLRGYGYFIKKNYKASTSDFRAVLRLDPENAYAKETLAEITRLEQQAARAKQQAEQQAARNALRSMMGSGDPYADAYNFGYQLGLDMLLGN